MSDPTETRVTAKSPSDVISVELSSRSTGMSLQRTRMSADRTLMSVMRTSLSLIGFGFTIFQAFQKAHEAQILKSAQAPRTFGQALVLLGLVMLALGIAYHVRFMVELRRRRDQLTADGLIHGQGEFPISLTLIFAVLLFGIGLFAIASMVFDAGPFT